MQLGPDLIYRPNPITPRFLSKNKKQDDFIFQNIFYNFLQITQIFLLKQLQATPSQKYLFKPKEKMYQNRKILLG